MNKCYVVVEGPSDEAVLRHLLDPLDGNAQLEFRAAGGRSAADSLARSLLVSGRGDVAVVVDADSVDASLVEERKQFLTRSLSEIASPAKWHVTVMAPELEALFFKHKDILQCLVGHPVSDIDLASGYYEPKKTLARLLGKTNLAPVFQQTLPKLDLQQIREESPIRELHEFLQGVTRQAVA